MGRESIQPVRKTIGILGGMGPLATADLFRKIILHTDAASDQEHLHVCIDSNTAIPDRTEALLRGGADPMPEMVESARRLEAAGADVIAMPCNTAHCFYEPLARAVSVPILHMIDLTRDALVRQGIQRAGLLATDGTVRSGIYQERFAESGIALLVPDEAGQSAVMGICYDGVKAGNRQYDEKPFRAACERLMEQGAETLILGCTELPPAFEQYALDYPAADPTTELALAAIRFAGGAVKE